MCGRYSLGCDDVDALREGLDFEIFSETGLTVVPRYNIAPAQRAVIVRWVEDRPVLAKRQWGFVRPEGGIAINARSERASRTPLFCDAFAKSRCLVPADGFFEWRREGKINQPYWFVPADGRLMLMAGLCEQGRFAVMTMSASEPVREIHDRMPVMVAHAHAIDWLDKGKLTAGVSLTKRQVSTRVNRVKHDDPLCVAPADQQAFDFGR